MFSPALSTLLLALSTQVLANNGSQGVHTGSSYSRDPWTNSTIYATPASTSVAYGSATGTYTTVAAVPIYSCVYYVNASATTGVYTSVPTGGPNNFTTYDSSTINGTEPSTSYAYASASGISYSTTYASPSGSYSTSYASASAGTYSGSYKLAPAGTSSGSSPYAIPSSVSYSFRPLTSTIYATLYTTDGAITTVYATPTSVLIGYPTGLPICDPYSSNGSGSSSSSALPETSGSALQANNKPEDNTPSTGFTLKQNVAGITLGAVAGIALTML